MLYTIRALYLLLHFLAVCGYALVYCLFFPRRLNNTSKLARMMSWGLPLVGVKVTAKNHSPLPPSTPAIYISNHQDTLDIFTYTAVMPDNMAILGKSSLRWIPLFGLAFWLAGNIFINRKDKSKAWKTMAEVGEVVKQRGNSLYMFPEGTRSRGRGLLPFKRGAFVLAIETGLPLVPIVFSSTHKNVNFNKWQAGSVLAEYLEPIPTSGLSQEDMPELLEHCRATIAAAIERLDAELQQD